MLFQSTLVHGMQRGAARLRLRLLPDAAAATLGSEGGTHSSWRHTAAAPSEPLPELSSTPSKARERALSSSCCCINALASRRKTANGAPRIATSTSSASSAASLPSFVDAASFDDDELLLLLLLRRPLLLLFLSDVPSCGVWVSTFVATPVCVSEVSYSIGSACEPHPTPMSCEL